MTQEQSLSLVEREAVARIIDQKAWAWVDRMHGGRHKTPKAEWAVVQPSLAQADAIFALFRDRLSALSLLGEGEKEGCSSVANSTDAPCFAVATEAQRKSEELIDRAQELEDILGDLLRDHGEREAIGGGPHWKTRHAETWRRASEVYGEDGGEP